jgi:hypothetical protein
VPHVISFDIDGTLVTGNGPGPITLEMVRRAVEHGHIIGSASDRPVPDQQNMWARAGIEVSFTIGKHRLSIVKEQFAGADAFFHIGDTELDEHFAILHGFEFLQVQTMDPCPWMLEEDGRVLWGPQGRSPLAAPTPVAPVDPEVPPGADILPDADEYDYSNG